MLTLKVRYSRIYNNYRNIQSFFNIKFSRVRTTLEYYFYVTYKYSEKSTQNDITLTNIW